MGIKIKILCYIEKLDTEIVTFQNFGLAVNFAYFSMKFGKSSNRPLGENLKKKKKKKRAVRQKAVLGMNE